MPEENPGPKFSARRRCEQIKRWEASDISKASSQAKLANKIRFLDTTVFLAACSASDIDEVKKLLKRGADINTSNIDGLTALHQACIDDNLTMVQFLVKAGANINQGDNEGWTPLHAAASCGFLEIVKYLVKNGANIAAVNSDGELPLDITESVDIEKYLQDEIDQKGIRADEARNEEINQMIRDVKSWIRTGVVRDRPHPKTGATALHVAAAKGYIAVMKLLIEAGVAVDAPDYDGWTPLHAAAHWNQREAVKLLIMRGARTLAKDNSGFTPAEVSDGTMSRYIEEMEEEAKTNRAKNYGSSEKHRSSITSNYSDTHKPESPLSPTMKHGPSGSGSGLIRMSKAEKSRIGVEDHAIERIMAVAETGASSPGEVLSSPPPTATLTSKTGGGSLKKFKGGSTIPEEDIVKSSSSSSSATTTTGGTSSSSTSSLIDTRNSQISINKTNKMTNRARHNDMDMEHLESQHISQSDKKTVSGVSGKSENKYSLHKVVPGTPRTSVISTVSNLSGVGRTKKSKSSPAEISFSSDEEEEKISSSVSSNDEQKEKRFNDSGKISKNMKMAVAAASTSTQLTSIKSPTASNPTKISQKTNPSSLPSPASSMQSSQSNAFFPRSSIGMSLSSSATHGKPSSFVSPLQSPSRYNSTFSQQHHLPPSGNSTPTSTPRSSIGSGSTANTNLLSGLLSKYNVPPSPTANMFEQQGGIQPNNKDGFIITNTDPLLVNQKENCANSSCDKNENVKNVIVGQPTSPILSFSSAPNTNITASVPASTSTTPSNRPIFRFSAGGSSLHKPFERNSNIENSLSENIGFADENLTYSAPEIKFDFKPPLSIAAMLDPGLTNYVFSPNSNPHFVVHSDHANFSNVFAISLPSSNNIITNSNSHIKPLVPSSIAPISCVVSPIAFNTTSRSKLTSPNSISISLENELDMERHIFVNVEKISNLTNGNLIASSFSDTVTTNLSSISPIIPTKQTSLFTINAFKPAQLPKDPYLAQASYYAKKIAPFRPLSHTPSSIFQPASNMNHETLTTKTQLISCIRPQSLEIIPTSSLVSTGLSKSLTFTSVGIINPTQKILPLYNNMTRSGMEQSQSGSQQHVKKIVKPLMYYYQDPSCCETMQKEPTIINGEKSHQSIVNNNSNNINYDTIKKVKPGVICNNGPLPPPPPSQSHFTALLQKYQRNCLEPLNNYANLNGIICSNINNNYYNGPLTTSCSPSVQFNHIIPPGPVVSKLNPQYFYPFYNSSSNLSSTNSNNLMASRAGFEGKPSLSQNSIASSTLSSDHTTTNNNANAALNNNEAQRKARSKRARESRRSTQGVTAEDIKAAEKQLEEIDITKSPPQDTPSELGNHSPSQVLSHIELSHPTASSQSSLASTTATVKPTKTTARVVPLNIVNSNLITRSTSSAASLSRVSTGTALRTHDIEDQSSATTTTSSSSSSTGTSSASSSPPNSPQKSSFSGVPGASFSGASSGTANSSIRRPVKDYEERRRVLEEQRQRAIEERKASITNAISAAAAASSTVAAARNVSSSTLIKTSSAHNASSTTTVGGGATNGSGSMASSLESKRHLREKRRSTGICDFDNQYQQEDESTEPGQQRASHHDDEEDLHNQQSSTQHQRRTTPSTIPEKTSTSVDNLTYKKMYEEVKIENSRLKSRVKELEKEVQTYKNDRKALIEVKGTIGSTGDYHNNNNENVASVGFSKKEKRILESKIAELEEELKKMESLKEINQRLKHENGALIRVISKLSK